MITERIEGLDFLSRQAEMALMERRKGYSFTPADIQMGKADWEQVSNFNGEPRHLPIYSTFPPAKQVRIFKKPLSLGESLAWCGHYRILRAALGSDRQLCKFYIIKNLGLEARCFQFLHPRFHRVHVCSHKVFRHPIGRFVRRFCIIW